MNVYHIVYASSISGVFCMVIGMCICSLYRHNIYLPRQSYEDGNIELTECDSSDDEGDNNEKVISARL